MIQVDDPAVEKSAKENRPLLAGVFNLRSFQLTVLAPLWLPEISVFGSALLPYRELWPVYCASVYLSNIDSDISSRISLRSRVAPAVLLYPWTLSTMPFNRFCAK
jgi:hypothetical protein